MYKYLSMDSSGSTRRQLEQAEGGHKNTPAVKIELKTENPGEGVHWY